MNKTQNINTKTFFHLPFRINYVQCVILFTIDAYVDTKN
jgi:hypothetical protein